MEGAFLFLTFLALNQAGLPVTAQTVTIYTRGAIVENSDVTFDCVYTGDWDPSLMRQWIGPGSTELLDNGLSADATKYTESLDIANNKFSMTVHNYKYDDEGAYQCRYGFTTSSSFILSASITEVHPAVPPLDNIVIPGASEAIDLTLFVTGIRPNATASFNLLSSGGTVISTGNAASTVTDDGNGRTFSSSLKIDVPACTTFAGDIFTVKVSVGSYSQTRLWRIGGTCN